RFEANIPKDQAVWIHLKNTSVSIENHQSQLIASIHPRNAEQDHTFSTARASFKDIDAYAVDPHSANKAVFFAESGYQGRGKGWYWVYPSKRVLERRGEALIRRYDFNGPFESYEEAEGQRLVVSRSKASHQVASARRVYKGAEPLA